MYFIYLCVLEIFLCLNEFIHEKVSKHYLKIHKHYSFLAKRVIFGPFCNNWGKSDSRSYRPLNSSKRNQRKMRLAFVFSSCNFLTIHIEFLNLNIRYYINKIVSSNKSAILLWNRIFFGLWLALKPFADSSFTFHLNPG